MSPLVPIERLFARDKAILNVMIGSLIKTAETSSIGIALLQDLQRWCSTAQARIETAIISLEQAL